MGIFDRLRKKDSGPITEIYSKEDYLGIELPKPSIKSVEDKPVEIKAELLKKYPETKQFFEKTEEQATREKEWQDELKKRAEEKEAREKAASETFKKILEIDNKIKEIMDTPLTVEDDFKLSLKDMPQEEALKKYREARLGPSAYGEKRADEVRMLFEEMADLLAKLKSDRFADNVKLSEAIKLKVEAIENSYKYSNLKALNPQDYKNSYDRSVRHMDDEIIKKINRDIFGYSVKRGDNFQKILNETKSFNELLNLVHTYVTENQDLLQGLNEWGKYEDLEAYGEETPIARRIFEELKLNNLNFGRLFSFGDTVHVTIRDVGHALSITVEGQEGKELTVQYKIPKAYGRDYVEHLRGLKVYDDEGKTARGNFFLPSSDIGYALVKFIKQVPTDATSLEDIEKFKKENALEQEKEIKAQIAKEKLQPETKASEPSNIKQVELAATSASLAEAVEYKQEERKLEEEKMKLAEEEKRYEQEKIELEEKCNKLTSDRERKLAKSS